MDKKIGYTIVAVCPSEIQKKFDLLKKKLFLLNLDKPKIEKNLILKNTAHFALKRTFYLKDNITESDLLSSSKNITFPKIKIDCEESGIFENSNFGAMVFLKIKVTNELRTLHQQIKNKIDDFVITKNPEHEGIGWLPHITFSYNTRPENMTVFRNILGKDLLPMKFELRKIYLLKNFNNEKDEREILKEIKNREKYKF